MGRSTISMAMFNSFVKLPVGISINIPVLSHQYPMDHPYKTIFNHSKQDGAPKIAKLPYFSGFMVDITIVFIGVISWFINPQTSLGGPHPEPIKPIKPPLVYQRVNYGLCSFLLILNVRSRSPRKKTAESGRFLNAPHHRASS